MLRQLPVLLFDRSNCLCDSPSPENSKQRARSRVNLGEAASRAAQPMATTNTLTAEGAQNAEKPIRNYLNMVKTPLIVIPAKAGSQSFLGILDLSRQPAVEIKPVDLGALLSNASLLARQAYPQKAVRIPENYLIRWDLNWLAMPPNSCTPFSASLSMLSRLLRRVIDRGFGELPLS